MEFVLRTITILDVARIAAGLMSDEGENPEYDRACAEIVRDVIGLDADKQEVHDFLRRIKR